MNYGFIKTAAVTPRLRVADCRYNAENIIKGIKEAAQAGVKLAVFPELCITGYTCSDLFLQPKLLEAAWENLCHIAEETKSENIVALVGLPVLYGYKTYNCAAVLCGGRLLGLVPKTNLPNYSEFYEARQFYPAKNVSGEVDFSGEKAPFSTDIIFRCASMPEFTFAVEICEDLWAPQSPSLSHAVSGALIIANLSAGDEVIGKAEYRRQLVSSQSAKLICGYIYANAGEGESTTDMVFSGHSMIYENGMPLAESKLFSRGMITADIDVSRLRSERAKNTTYPAAENKGYITAEFDISTELTGFSRQIPANPFVPQSTADLAERCSLIVSMQASGLSKRLTHTGAKTAVIGLSGGLDSTLALLVSCAAFDSLGLPRTGIKAVSMPCFGTTKRTKNNAAVLAGSLGVSFETIDITAAVNRHFRDIGQDPQNFDVTFENSQARERTQVLMDIANKTGGLVIGTGDLSELALGWATYNGDHMSNYGVNCSIPKTLVRHLVRYFSANSEDKAVRKTLEDILATPVSPELLPAENGVISQKTEDIVGPYELHDFFLYYMIRQGFSPAKIYFLACRAFEGVYQPETIKKWLVTFVRRFFAMQFKRSCLPDGPKVGTLALSPRGDWRMPSDACAAIWLEEAENL